MKAATSRACGIRRLEGLVNPDARRQCFAPTLRANCQCLCQCLLCCQLPTISFLLGILMQASSSSPAASCVSASQWVTWSWAASSRVQGTVLESEEPESGVGQRTCGDTVWNPLFPRQQRSDWDESDAQSGQRWPEKGRNQKIRPSWLPRYTLHKSRQPWTT